MKTNFLFYFNAYSDFLTTTTPSLNNFKWSREINGVPYNLENSQQIQVPASSTSPNIVPYPFSNAPANPTGTIATGVNTITALSSTAGIVIGQLIIGGGIPVGTIVESIVGSVVTMSANATSSGTAAFSFYAAASFMYMESDQQVSVIYNNGSPMALNPFEINGIVVPGAFFLNGPVYSITVTNSGATAANIYLALMG